MIIFGWEIKREKEEKENIDTPALTIVTQNGKMDSTQQCYLAFYDTMIEFKAFNDAWVNSSWWARLKFRFRLFWNPKKIIRNVYLAHTKEFVDDYIKMLKLIKANPKYN